MQIPIAAANSAGLIPGGQLAGMAGEDPEPGETAQCGRNHNPRGGHGREHPPVAAQDVGFQMQAGDQAENQNRDRADPGQRRQRCRIDERLKHAGSQAAEHRWPQGDA